MRENTTGSIVLDHLEVAHAGLSATVTKSQEHPEYYLWIDVAGSGRYFLGVLERGMTRGDVRRMAESFLQRKSTHA